MKAAAITDVGRVRELNEDNYFIYEEEIKLYIVADGMGGHKSGEVASFIAIDVIKSHIIKYLDDEREEIAVKGILFEAFNRANEAILNKSIEDSTCEGMGTTVTLVLIIEDKMYIAHVGDSRAYLIRENEITQITEDHSLVAELVKNGSITEREAMRHPQKNIITRALGNSSDVKLDLCTIQLCKEDILILCTDGLSNFVDNYEFKKVLSETEDIMEACNILVTLANERGGHDNITVLIAKQQSSSIEGR
ncbi:MAG: Stp1/IreP family PP2C-type Ser/Thr phosphatase [Clostridiaceae bacterium]|nr:Stp1/IreP family PP2C-type Ser/Thr phosphatase [Clostridiaceae bacterium]